MISPEPCRSPAKGKMIHLADHILAVKYDTKNPIVITDGSTGNKYRIHCIARGWITRETFFPHGQRTTRKVTMSTGKVLSHSAQVLPYAMEELGCETFSLDPYVYIRYYADICVFQVLRTEDLNMVKQGSQFYIISGPDSTIKFVFEVKNNPQYHCAKPTDTFPINYHLIYVAIISGGFDMKSGKNVVKERNGATQLLQYITLTENNGLLNFMHTIRNTRPTQPTMKTCI